MDILEYLKHPFALGLLGGLVVAGFVWKSGFSARRRLGRELRKLEGELRDLQSHLNVQLKINAQGNETLQRELEELRRHNENLRISVATLQVKPGRAELRHLRVSEGAVRLMREQAPGFAPVWEKAMRQAEADLEAEEGGLRKLIRRVVPGIGPGSGGAAGGVKDSDA